MVKFFAQTHLYDEPWHTVALAFFLRYPNPYASHVLSCDVISRTVTPEGSLLSTRLILKRGALPKWAPRGIVSRAESWVIEESEVDPMGRTVRCRTRNLDHVRVMQVSEQTSLAENFDGRTTHRTEARVVSNFGWGLAKRIEKYGVNKFKANIERSREGISLVLQVLREYRLQQLALNDSASPVFHLQSPPNGHRGSSTADHDSTSTGNSRSWFRFGRWGGV